MSGAQPDEQVLERATEIVNQLLEPLPQQQQVVHPQQAGNQLEQEQLQNPQENEIVDQNNNDAQDNQAQELGGLGEVNPQPNAVSAARPLAGRSPETCQMIRRLLRAIPLASNTQLEEMYNVFAGHVPSGHGPPPNDHTYPPRIRRQSKPVPHGSARIPGTPTPVSTPTTSPSRSALVASKLAWSAGARTPDGKQKRPITTPSGPAICE